MVKREEAILEEFRALRQELLGVQTARLWGTLTYVVLAGGVAAIETKSQQTYLYLFLIMMALPFLWHIANRERSRLRIAAYIKVVIEEQIPGFGWESHLSEWRKLVPGVTRLERIVDRWRYIFALTGVYVIIIFFSFSLLMLTSCAFLLKLGGVLGVVLCLESHRYLNNVLSSASKYEEIFRKAATRLKKEEIGD